MYPNGEFSHISLTLESKESGMFKNILIVSILSLFGWQALSAGMTSRPPSKHAARADYRRPSQIPYPADNPYSDAKYQLGRDLFFDPMLSGAMNISCSTCHLPNRSWTDGRARAIGAAGKPLALKSPTLLNVAWMTQLGWDGKFADLESVAFAPILGKGNMNNTEAVLIERLKASPDYGRKFAAAFGDDSISRANIERALAMFERSIVSGEAPFDRWVEGDDRAISDAAKRGFALFNGKAACAGCHRGWSFTDGAFYDIGTAHGDDIGRGRYFQGSAKLRFAFKTPALRDVVRRPPDMHDGALATLDDVIDNYDKGAIKRPSRSGLIAPLGLTKAEKADLIEFLKALSSA